MELELRRQCLHLMDSVMKHCASHEETTDMIVPDASPDVYRILGAFGNAYLKDESVRDGQYTVSGMICGWVLYVSDDDMAVRHLEVQIPFSHTFDHSEIKADDVGTVKISLSSLEAREVNPRKITARANVALCATVYTQKMTEFVCSVENRDMYGVECKSESVSTFSPVAIAKKQFLLNDDIEMMEGKPTFASMLRYDAELRESDCKIVGNKAVVKGVAKLHCVYLSDQGEPITADQDLPYSQIIEHESMDESCELDVMMQAGDMKLEPQYDMTGNVNYFTLSLPIRMSAVVLKRQEMTPIVDLYSTKHPIETQEKQQEITMRKDMTSKRISVNETMMCDVPAERIVDVSVRAEPVRKRMEEGEQALACAMTVQVLYRDKDGVLAGVGKRTEAVCPVMDSHADYTAKAQVDGISCSVEPGNELAVRCYVDFEVAEWETKTLHVPNSVCADTEMSVRAENSPSVIARKVNPGDTLWKLAKQYQTTVDEIVSANRLVSSDIMVGEMLLIPRKTR
ncbi:MAG: DUF3794 domain-containing protein [Ruminococcaceae bacterium]|nr:DUF3794 domain-containing protein [Oscillospiraceae bacterium]